MMFRQIPFFAFGAIVTAGGHGIVDVKSCAVPGVCRRSKSSG